MKQEPKNDAGTVVTTTTVVAALEETVPGGTESENEAAARRLAEAEAAARKQGAIRLERPSELVGATWRIPFDGQNLYVTVNHDNQMIQEVFATGPISGAGAMRASKLPPRGCAPDAVSSPPTQNSTTPPPRVHALLLPLT